MPRVGWPNGHRVPSLSKSSSCWKSGCWGDLAISMVSPILGIGRLRGESRRDVSLRRPVVPALRQWPKQGDHDENDERLDQDRDIGAPGVLQTRSGELTSVERDVCDPVPSNGAEQRSSRPEHPSSPTSHPSRACQSSQLRAMTGWLWLVRPPARRAAPAPGGTLPQSRPSTKYTRSHPRIGWVLPGGAMTVG